MTHHHESFEKHEAHHAGACRVCSRHAEEDGQHPAIGICRPCWYKILMLVFIVMLTISYVAWYGIL